MWPVTYLNILYLLLVHHPEENERECEDFKWEDS